MQQFQLVSNGERSVILPYGIDMGGHRDGPFAPRSPTILAEDWIEAKAAFGFDLTALQTAMRGKSMAERVRLNSRWEAL